MKKRKMTSVAALMFPCTALLLVLWLLCMCFVTVLVAKDVQDVWEKIIDDAILDSFYSIPITTDTPVAPYRNATPMKEQFANNAFHLGDGADSAMVYFKDGEELLHSNYYGYILAWDANDWYSGDAEYEMAKMANIYANMTVYELPAIRVDLNRFFGYVEPTLYGPYGDGYFGSQGNDEYWGDANYLRFTGYFWNDDTFVPVSIATFNGNILTPPRNKTLKKIRNS